MIVVVGGGGRKAGKTTLIEMLIRALPEARWLAVKISGHAHGIQGWTIDREETPDPGTDTGRFLSAGACEAWWLRAEPGHLADAVPKLLSVMANFKNVVIESSSITEFIQPDLYLFVASGNVTARTIPPRG